MHSSEASSGELEVPIQLAEEAVVWLKDGTKGSRDTEEDEKASFFLDAVWRETDAVWTEQWWK